MRMSMRAVSPSASAALLAAILFCGAAFPAFASGDDKQATSSPKAAKPDNQKKVFTNDDVDRMWPKPQVLVIETPGTQPAAPSQQRRPASSSYRAPHVVNAPITPEKDPLWYAEQIESLNAVLASISSQEESLREFRAAGDRAGVQSGLRIYAPCDGYTTDNQIEQLAMRRQEIQQQINSLEATAQQNDMPPGILQNPSEILRAAQKPSSPEQEIAAVKERQAQLVGELNDVHSELSDMSAQAASQGVTLQPPTPGFGGNMTTNLVTDLDKRAGNIRSAIDENEDAARRAGLAPAALP